MANNRVSLFKSTRHSIDIIMQNQSLYCVDQIYNFNFQHEYYHLIADRICRVQEVIKQKPKQTEQLNASGSHGQTQPNSLGTETSLPDVIPQPQSSVPLYPPQTQSGKNFTLINVPAQTFLLKMLYPMNLGSYV